MKIRWSQTASDDLDQVPLPIAEELARNLELTAEFPLMHPVRQRGRFRGCRCFPVGPWLVYYRFVRREVVVLAIWHGTRRGA